MKLVPHRGSAPVEAADTGKAKSKKVFDSLMREKLEEVVMHRGVAKYVRQAIVDELVMQAVAGEQWAIQEVLTRVDGKPQMLNATDEGVLLTPIIYIPDNSRDPDVVEVSGIETQSE